MSRIASFARRAGLLIYTRWFCLTRGVRVGSGTRIYPGARVSFLGGGTITIGDHCYLHAGSLLATYGGDIEIGSHVSINDYTILYGHGGLTIGEGTRIAAHTVVIPANHSIDAGSPIRMQPTVGKGIRIGRDCWIGAGVRILDGVELADGCVVGAGSVVTPSLATEEMGIYVGVPARQVGSRKHNKAGE